jgi:hypothetical protein
MEVVLESRDRDELVDGIINGNCNGAVGFGGGGVTEPSEMMCA